MLLGRDDLRDGELLQRILRIMRLLHLEAGLRHGLEDRGEGPADRVEIVLQPGRVNFTPLVLSRLPSLPSPESSPPPSPFRTVSLPFSSRDLQ